MTNIGIITDTIRSPSVVCIADEIIIVAQGDSQTAVPIVQPVRAAGVMDENQFHDTIRRTWIISLGHTHSTVNK